jgi:hypothetical protein
MVQYLEGLASVHNVVDDRCQLPVTLPVSVGLSCPCNELGRMSQPSDCLRGLLKVAENIILLFLDGTFLGFSF